MFFAGYAYKLRIQSPEGFTISGFIQENYGGSAHRIYQVEMLALTVCAFAINLIAGGTTVAILTGMSYNIAIGIMTLIALSYVLLNGLKATVVTEIIKIGVVWTTVIGILALFLSHPDMGAGITPRFDGVGDGDGSSIIGSFGWGVFTSFGIAAFLGHLAGPWRDNNFYQRAFAIKKNHIIPAFILAACIFICIPLAMGYVGFIGAGSGGFMLLYVKVKDQEKKACSTALVMRKRLDDLRIKWQEENDWPDIVYSMQHRIGLNSGQMVTGNMGSEMRMNYTMMGDTVNLAARLEPAAKKYGVYIIVGENIYEASNDEYVFRFLDFLSVKGKSIPVKTYELIDTKDQINKKSLDLIETFEKGLDYYFNQDWENALKYFQKSQKLEDKFVGRDTNPSEVFIKRCKYFLSDPPKNDWDGVWIMNTK